MKYGRLEILRQVGKKGNHIKVEAVCDCGTRRTFNLDNIRSGATKSCGCLRRETTLRNNIGNKFGVTHGLSDSQEYNTYQHMIRRCKYEKLYVEKGIKVCKRWQGKDGFTNFIKDMGNKPSSNYSIDRIDNNGDYKPSNCRWATKKQQQNNLSTNWRITFNGVTKTLPEWEEVTSISRETIRSRIRRLGWSVGKALRGNNG